MQWKGPFEVSVVVGLTDYKVSVKGKVRIYHANLLKKYFEREHSVPVGAVAVEVDANNSNSGHFKSEVEEVDPVAGRKINFFSGSHLAPKYFKVVANSKNLLVITTNTQTIFTLSLYQID